MTRTQDLEALRDKVDAVCEFHGAMLGNHHGRLYCIDCEDFCPNCSKHGGIDDLDGGGIKCRYCGVFWQSSPALIAQEAAQAAEGVE